eukprot:CAMPEP_0202958828 /NCGR_PEP_ID=MMETSP1396-20130829/3093_1 /ASSEMBLY_ACC=CAM_ASM_000872 /TAXON_ID= /ORGANISM="Pseudokeronopsis sp., Strain Brazil" /LENGTH=114 /DNA_ID=CAMNT_0049677091 /DNA_START=321 /DNA_END=665 /DNA_ORIENTATION=-
MYGARLRSRKQKQVRPRKVQVVLGGHLESAGEGVESLSIWDGVDSDHGAIGGARGRQTPIEIHSNLQYRRIMAEDLGLFLEGVGVEDVEDAGVDGAGVEQVGVQVEVGGQHDPA